jgi:hypothetical protein
MREVPARCERPRCTRRPSASGPERPGEAGASGASLSEAPEGTAAPPRRRAPSGRSKARAERSDPAKRERVERA